MAKPGGLEHGDVARGVPGGEHRQYRRHGPTDATVLPGPSSSGSRRRRADQLPVHGRDLHLGPDDLLAAQPVCRTSHDPHEVPWLSVHMKTLNSRACSTCTSSSIG